MALCVSSDISVWPVGATPLKRLPLGGSDRFTQQLKNNVCTLASLAMKYIALWKAGKYAGVGKA